MIFTPAYLPKDLVIMDFLRPESVQTQMVMKIEEFCMLLSFIGLVEIPNQNIEPLSSN